MHNLHKEICKYVDIEIGKSAVVKFGNFFAPNRYQRLIRFDKHFIF